MDIMLFPDYPPSGVKTPESMRLDPWTGKVPLGGSEPELQPLPDTPNWDILLPVCRLDFKYSAAWEDIGKGDEQQQQAFAPQIQPPKIRQPSPSPAPSAFASSTASSMFDAPSPFLSFDHDSSTSVDDDSKSRPSSDSEERELRDEHVQTTTPDGWQDEETAVWSDDEGEQESSDDDIPAIESQPDFAHGARRPIIPLPARRTSSALPSGNLTTPPRVSGPSSSRLSSDTSSDTDETDSQPDDDSDYHDEDSRSTLKRPRSSSSAPKRRRTNANTALPSGQNKGKARATAKPAARASEQQFSQDDDGQWHCLYPGCKANLEGVSTENGIRRHWNSDHGPRGTCPACGKEFKNTRKDLLRKHLNKACPEKGSAAWKVATEKLNEEVGKRRRS
ncbi:hypothetical protein GGX14DRAFT_627262 [Mycena pura]|uniref:Uncharacterized protein n=1 Tax=Mycena pura TaxID=153505 RepID=A0AAD7E3N6_9AGAR|nr:hypothetical protein GGX14DRAFT_627262 [Mycena pura]